MANSSTKDEVQESEFNHARYRFPDFLWLLRDVSIKVPKAEKSEQMSIGEYILNELLESRKEVGEALENLFATVDFRTLQAPADASSLHKSFQNAKDPNSRFLQEVQSLVLYIYSRARAKHGFHKGERVDGSALSMLVKSCLEAINNPNAKPCTETSWKSVVQMRCSQVIAELVNEYEDEMRKKLTDMLPMEVSVSDPQNPEQPSLRQIHGDMLNRMLDKLREATQYYMLASKAKNEELRSQLIGEIIQETELRVGSTTTMKVVGGVACRFFDENERMSKSHCANVFDKVSQPLREKIKAAESDPSTSKSLQDVMEKEIEWLQAEYFTDAVGPAKEEVFQSKLKELKQYGSGVARFQQKIKQCMESAALEKQRLLDEIKEAKAATEEHRKTLVREQENMKREDDEHTKQVTDDLKRQLRDEQEKVKELTGKTNDTNLMPILTAITQYSQDLERINEASIMKQQRDVNDNAEKQKIDELKRPERMQKQAEMQAETPSKGEAYQPPSHVQYRKINLPDSAKERIAKKWFGCMPNKDKVISECKRLRLGTPRAGNFWRSEEAWIQHFGEQLYMEDIVMLKKTYDIEDTDIVVHKM